MILRRLQGNDPDTNFFFFTALHFNLTVESTTKPSDYDGAEFTYRPRLDNSRDAELMDMLPDFLTEEITFERSQAAKFYARVMKSMTERVE